MRNTNRELLLSAARLLRPLLDELVFVGGCATGLLITDEAAPDVRATNDVDAIAEITSYNEYALFSDRLRGLGFTEDATPGAPLCRWTHGGVILDVMPLDPAILGFSNRWYRPAMRSAQVRDLEPFLEIRTITAPFFLATKLEAFHGRGARDYFASHDLEDVLSVVDGRPELTGEVRESPNDLRAYLALEFRALLREPRFVDALAGHLLPDATSQARIPIILERMREIAAPVNLDAPWRDLATEMSALRSVFPPSEQGAAATKWFDEFLRETEFDLALHVVCDFLLEPGTPPASPQIQADIERLHTKMEIVDDCAVRLRQKALNA